MLPGKDGFEVCRELRRAGRRTPIIVLTARTHDAEKVMGLELGADDYITKPFNPRELRARIKAVLRRTTVVDGARRLALRRRRGGLRPRRGAARRAARRRQRARVQADHGIRPQTRAACSLVSNCSTRSGARASRSATASSTTTSSASAGSSSPIPPSRVPRQRARDGVSTRCVNRRHTSLRRRTRSVDWLSTLMSVQVGLEWSAQGEISHEGASLAFVCWW